MKTKDLKVFQANTYTMSKQTFNVNEKRVMQFIIAKIKPTDTEFERYTIPISDIADMAKISSKNMYTFAKTLMVDMITKFVLLQDEEQQKIKAFNYFTELEYHSGIITVELNRNIHQLFLQLKRNKTAFTAYELTEFMTLSSFHAQRIYELLKQYSKSKQREREIPMEQFRELLNIQNKYKLYADFRKRILEYAHKHIEENTNLRYKWAGVTKRGRKVIAIHFYEIHEAGKESPTKLQEKVFLENYINKEIYNEELNTYLTIRNIIRNKDKSYTITDKFDGIGYDYLNLETLQQCIAKAITQKGLLQ
jgi:plasmid replication initiation protein